MSNASCRRAVYRALGLLLTMTLTACAGQQAFRAGSRALVEADYERALDQYQLASQTDPGNAEYRAAWLNARAKALQTWFEVAETARHNGRAGEASAGYKRMLGVDAAEPRAHEGLRLLERANRHAQYVAEAEAASKQGELDQALGALRLVLQEDPRHEAALQLQRNIEGWRARPVGQAEGQLAAAYRKPVSIEFRDAQLREVLETLSRSSGLNFVLDRDVRADQRTSLFLRNSNVGDALSLVLVTNQLSRRVLDGNTVLIYPNTPAKAHDYQALSVKTLHFNHAEAKTVASTLRTILKTKDVVVLEKQNSLILRDTPEAIRMAEQLAQVHDQPEPEVMLEVEVLEVQRSRLLNLGVQFPTQLTLSPLSTGSEPLTLNQLKGLNGDSIAAKISAVTINANHNVGDVRILANPRIRAVNHQEAQIMVGQRVPTVTTTTTATGFSANSVQYLDVGLKLIVEPSISPDNDVAIKLKLEVSSVTNTQKLNDGTTTYEIGTRSVSTLLRLHDGENQVLAGLINDQQNSNSNRLPGLGDIPLLGRLFATQLDNNQQSEIVLSITPRILRSARRTETGLSEFAAGTEGSLRAITSGNSEPVYGSKPATPPELAKGANQ